MNTPTFLSPACSGARDTPREKSPTSLVKPPANASHCLNGTYSPNGTQWSLSYSETQSPSEFISAAALKTSAEAARAPPGVRRPMFPATTQEPELRAISLSVLRNEGSLL